MTLVEIRAAVLRLSWLDTLTAVRFCEACGVDRTEASARAEAEPDHSATERMMRQRWGAMDRRR